MLKDWRLIFEISERKLLLKTLDIVFVFIIIYLVSSTFDFKYFEISKKHLISLTLLSSYLLLFGTIFNMYVLNEAISIYKTIKNIFFTTTSTLFTYLLTPILSPPLPENRLQILYLFFSILIGLFIGRYIYILLFSNYNFNKQFILICHKNDLETLKSELETSSPHIKVAHFYFLDENNLIFDHQITLQELKNFVKVKAHYEIVVACPDSSNITIDLNNLLLKLIEKGYSVKQYTHVFEDLSFRVPVHLVEKDFYKYFPFSRSNSNQLYLFVNRLIDVIFSLVGLVLFIPFFVLILIFNMFWNRGTPIYTQKRVGKFGENFKIYKLRTMVVNAEQDGAVFAQKNDSRITTFGKFLRKIRFDEVPQLFNVIKNEMSLIGPRPERPEFVKDLNKIMPFYETRHMIKPGLTGWAQVNYDYGSSYEDSLIKLQYDLYYIKNRNIFLDVNIILKTLNTVLFMKGQ